MQMAIVIPVADLKDEYLGGYAAFRCAFSAGKVCVRTLSLGFHTLWDCLGAQPIAPTPSRIVWCCLYVLRFFDPLSSSMSALKNIPETPGVRMQWRNTSFLLLHYMILRCRALSLAQW